MSKLILASKSPRRKEILAYLNIPFEVVVSNADESINENNDLRDEIESLSFKKALAVFEDHKDTVVIGCDTIVTLDHQVLGKPKDEDEAFAMLTLLQGKTHEVITGCSIISNKQSETFSTVTEVTFKPLTYKEIEDYIKTNEPLDKAGAYAIQGQGGKFITSINGDYYSVMGLPLSELHTRLKKYL